MSWMDWAMVRDSKCLQFWMLLVPPVFDSM
jgi:hypothetical protein